MNIFWSCLLLLGSVWAGSNEVLLKDIQTGTSDGVSSSLVVFNNKMYFIGNDGNNGKELWVSDGTEANTQMLHEFSAGSASTEFSKVESWTIFGNHLIFSIKNAGNTEIWQVNSSNTVQKISTGVAGEPIQEFLECNGTLYFAFDDGSVGVELYKMTIANGGPGITTVSNPVLVKNINASAPPVSEPSSSPSDFACFTNKLYFAATDDQYSGRELWESDGSVGNTSLVDDLHIGTGLSSNPKNLFTFGSKLLFQADNGTSGRELWVSEGETPTLLKNINSGSSHGNPSSFTELNGVVFFAAEGDNKGDELWRTDGTTAGTYLVSDIETGTLGSSPSHFVVHNNLLYFFTTTSSGTAKLYSQSSAAALTPTLIKDFGVGIIPVLPAGQSPGVAYWKNKLFFTGASVSGGIEMWLQSGATVAEAFNMNSGTAHGMPTSFVELGGRLFFIGTSTGAGREIHSINLAPNSLSLTSETIFENNTAGSFIGTFSATDENNDSPLQYSIAANELDASAVRISNDSLFSAVSFDADFKPNYKFKIRVSDGKGGTLDTLQTFSVNSVNEKPVFKITPSLVAKTQTQYTYPAYAKDPDANDAITYSVTAKPSWLQVEFPVLGETKVALGTGSSGSPTLATGSLVSVNNTFALHSPTGIVEAPDRSVYVVEKDNHRVLRYFRNGKIQRVVGTGTGGFSGDGGIATNAQLRNPTSIAIDASGVLYIADAGNHRIRKVDAAGIITTIAGTGTAGFNGDNLDAKLSKLNNPSFVLLEGSTLYFSDTDNHRVRSFDVVSVPMITTIAGTGASGYAGDNGAASAAKLHSPRGLFYENSQLYIADAGNHRVRKINFNLNSEMSTVAGDGSANLGAENIAATSSPLNTPTAILFKDFPTTAPSGRPSALQKIKGRTLVVLEAGNNRIRAVDSQNLIHTIMGTGLKSNTIGQKEALQDKLNKPVSMTALADGPILVANADGHSIASISMGHPYFKGTPAVGDIGNAQVTVVATDKQSLSSTKSFSIAVSSANNAPQWADTLRFSSNENVSKDTKIGQLQATDSDNDALSYSLLSSSTKVKIERDGIITWLVSPNFENQESLTYNVEVTDGTDKDTSVMIIAIVDVNELPLVDTLTFTWKQGEQAALFLGNLSGSDPEGSNVKFQISDEKTPFEITEAGALSWKVLPSLPKDTLFNVELRITDGVNSVNGLVKVQFLSNNIPPTITWSDSTISRELVVGDTALRFRIEDKDIGDSGKIVLNKESQYFRIEGNALLVTEALLNAPAKVSLSYELSDTRGYSKELLQNFSISGTSEVPKIEFSLSGRALVSSLQGVTGQSYKAKILLGDSVIAEHEGSSSWTYFPLQEGKTYTLLWQVEGLTAISQTVSLPVLPTDVVQEEGSAWRMRGVGSEAQEASLISEEVLFTWNELDSSGFLGAKYIEFSGKQMIRPGTGFWADATKGSFPEQKIADSIVVFLYNKGTGWNLIANPYPFALDVFAAGLPTGSLLWSWNPQKYSYTKATFLKPYEAVWVWVEKSVAITLKPKPYFTVQKSGSISASRQNVFEGFSLRLHLVAGEFESHDVELGVSLKQARPAIPSPHGPHVSLAVLQKSKVYSSLSFETGRDFYSWELTPNVGVAGLAQGELSFQLESGSLSDYDLYLEDNGKQNSIALDDAQVISLTKSSKLWAVRKGYSIQEDISFENRILRWSSTTSNTLLRVEIFDARGKSLWNHTQASEQTQFLEIPKLEGAWVKVKQGPLEKVFSIQ